MKRLGIIFAIATAGLAPCARAATRLGLGAGVRYLHYAEDVQSPLLSTQFGWLPDLMAYVEHEPDDRSWFVHAKIDYAAANLTYSGTTQLPTVEAITSVDPHAFWVIEGLYGRRLTEMFSGTQQLYLYGGLSYRLWYRDLANPSEVYKLLSVPVGVRLEPSQPASFSVSYDLSLRPMVFGRVSATYSSATGYDPLTVPVSIGYLGFRAELPMRWAIGEGWGLRLRPWFEYSTISQGPVEPVTINGQNIKLGSGYQGVSEPSSQTWQVGSDVSAEAVF